MLLVIYIKEKESVVTYISPSGDILDHFIFEMNYSIMNISRIRYH